MKKKKRILWHLPFGMIGGVETLTATILKYIDKEKFEHFVTCHQLIKDWCSAKYRGIQVYPFVGQSDLADQISILKPDVIMGTHGRTLYEALNLLQKDIPVIEGVHGSHIWSEHNVYMPKDWTKHTICVSKSAERVYLENSSSPIPTSIIINGVDTEIFNPQKQLPLQAKVIGYIGRFLEGDKQIKEVIKAFKGIGDHTARLHLTGGTRAEIVHLDHFCKALKIHQSVKFFEHTTTPEKCYKGLDIFTVRSPAEGYCNSVAEALATGTPCVCYNFGGIIDHVPRGTIAVGSTQIEYAAKLREVYSDYALRVKMRNLGLDFINREGNAQIMVGKYEQVITSVLAGTTAKLKNSPKKKEEPLTSKELEMPFVNTRISHTRPVVGLCNPSWHGIATATRNICDEVVPWHPDHQIMVRNIVRYDPRAVLFSGMCPGFDLAATFMNRNHPKYPLYFYYHGGASHYSFQNGLFGHGEREAFQKGINLHLAGVFKKIAVASPGLADVLQANGIKAQFCGNKTPKFKLANVPRLAGFHIGNWNRNLDHKHTSIGIAAGQLIPGSVVHCLKGYPEIPGVDYTRVKSHLEMPQQALYEKYAQMTVNLQLSFIETFNISVLEMWAAGTPVLLGPGNYELVRNNPTLLEHCLVVDHTNPVEVANKIFWLQKLSNLIVEEQLNHSKVLDVEVSKRWENFFL